MFFFQPDTMGYTFGNGAVTNGEVMDWLQTGVTPGYNGNEGGGGLDWQSIINQGFGAASQIFSAWGRNQTQQTGVGGVPIGGGYSPAQVLGAAGQIQNNTLTAQQQAALLSQQRSGGSGTNSLDGIVGSLTNLVANNPIPLAIGAIGLYLLFKEPPRGRR